MDAVADDGGYDASAEEVSLSRDCCEAVTSCWAPSLGGGDLEGRVARCCCCSEERSKR